MSTDNKTLAVDVLAVMDSVSLSLFEACRNADARSLDKARAAVAELIDVYEELLNELREISDEAGQEPYNNPRANAALARVKGESA